MNDNVVPETLARAVGQAYEEWSVEHPSLAAVIDRTRLSGMAVDRLRETAEFRRAVASYYRNRSEVELLDQLLSLAGGAIRAVVG